MKKEHTHIESAKGFPSRTVILWGTLIVFLLFLGLGLYQYFLTPNDKDPGAGFFIFMGLNGLWSGIIFSLLIPNT